MNTLKDFTNLYQLSKTLRFELKPVGKTLEHIQNSGILENDEHRAESYILVKKIIDEYHKHFIEDSLEDLKLDSNDLSEYYLYFQIRNREESQQKAFGTVKSKLRKQISKSFDTKRLFGKELIREDLLGFITEETDKQLVQEFKNFTTYFTGFHKNRKNMYSSEEKSNTIAYRLIHENLPKFINNMTIFDKIKQPLANNLQTLYNGFNEYLNVREIAELFTLDYFSKVLTQKQIDVYNLMIGGKTLENGTKLQGLNEYINLYNQQQTDRNARLPKLTPLFKQILSDRETISWLPEMFANDNELLESIEKVYQEIPFGEIKSIIEKLHEYDLPKIYVRNDLGLTDISQHLLGNYAAIPNAIKENIKQSNPQKGTEQQENYEERINKLFKSRGSFSIDLINKVIPEKSLVTYFKNCNKTEENPDLLNRIQNCYLQVKNLLNTDYPAEKSLKQDKQNIEKIKQLLDSIKEFQRFIKPLLGKGDEANKDAIFYVEFEKLWHELDRITPLYNMVRNYVTQKPYSTEKIKLNFENSTLLNGWDVNQERDNISIILRKGELYYLAIINKKNNTIFLKENTPSTGNCYEKMEYKLLPGANKMLPKVFFSESRIDEFKPSKQLLENYNNETHKKGEKFNLEDCRNLIDFFKQSINKHEDWKNFGFQFSDTSTYQDLSGFYREVEQQGYKITFRNISEDYINQLVEEGKLYLFQIYNKDFSPFSKGTPNMHTLYWKMLFTPENLQNVIYKLDGQAEVFFRKKSLNYTDETWQKGHHYDKLKNKFAYPIISKRRYALDKFQFHVPVTMNFKAVGNERINELVNQFIKNNGIEHIIGIDRGERHLLYLSLIDLNGKIVKQFSLNEIGNEYKDNIYKINYRDLLDKKETERDDARKSWNEIETIKELKEGYLSQVIHKITQLIIEYKAIVVLEDLNFGFMRGRQKVEKQVYQKFEKMLIDKLNYLVDKKKQVADEGGLLNAYQLTNKFESFKKEGKQNGFLFYVPAWNTSKIDPVTGFVNLFNVKYESVSKAQEFFKKFDCIRFNQIDDNNCRFDFYFDYKNFTDKAEGSQTKWTLCSSNDTRYRWNKSLNQGKGAQEEVKVTEALKLLFSDKDYNIAYGDGKDLRERISNQTSAKFFKELMSLLSTLLSMRHNNGKKCDEEQDFILSPVEPFFNSLHATDEHPKDADANGAYNIARKGLWVLQQIGKATDLKKVELTVKNKEWLRFAQNKNTQS
jgi:hypothetical protein